MFKLFDPATGLYYNPKGGWGPNGKVWAKIGYLASGFREFGKGMPDNLEVIELEAQVVQRIPIADIQDRNKMNDRKRQAKEQTVERDRLQREHDELTVRLAQLDKKLN